MSNYLIHACPERMWYVERYLIRSMEEQGIGQIDVRCDNDHLGNLESTMRIFGSMPDNEDGTWHLQDDIIICRNFKKMTEENDDGVVCGFTATGSNSGVVNPDKMWWSFPCIRIPNKIARGCAEWFYSFAKHYAKYYEWNYLGKCDDNFFREYLLKNVPDINVVNMKPNLVDHIDYLLGGSVINQYRGDAQVRSQYFCDLDLVKRLEEDLKSE